jgi:carotenoid cleavage dioxygenase
MIHTLVIPPLNAADDTLWYSSTYVDTHGRQVERQRGRGFRLVGTLGAAPRGLPLLGSIVRNMASFAVGTKDTCNTALAEHGGRILALMEQSPPSELAVYRDGSVQTIKAKTHLNGAIPKSDPLTGGSLSAHGRTCPITGERIHVSYGSTNKPFARVDVFSPQDWTLQHSIPMYDLDTPVMIHDCAITRNYVLVLDFPLTVRPSRMLRDRFPVEYEPENGARIGLVPRDGVRATQWFSCRPGVILHTVNAFERDDGKVVFQALRSEPSGDGSYISEYTTAFLYEWTLDPATNALNPKAT